MKPPNIHTTYFIFLWFVVHGSAFSHSFSSITFPARLFPVELHPDLRYNSTSNTRHLTQNRSIRLSFRAETRNPEDRMHVPECIKRGSRVRFSGGAILALNRMALHINNKKQGHGKNRDWLLFCKAKMLPVPAFSASGNQPSQ